jgi:hypothetical protein
MNSSIRFLTLMAALGVSPLIAQVSVPPLMNYQGQLASAAGTPLATADYTLTFRIYDAAQGGTLVWGPQVFDGTPGQGHGPKIPVVQGYFNVMLGPTDTAGVALPTAFNGTNRFVEIKVGTDNPILPRQQLLSAPFALKSGMADLASNALAANNSLKLAGFDWSAILAGGGSNPATGRIAGAKIEDGSITTSGIAPGAVTSAQIANGAINSSHLSQNFVPTGALQDGSVTQPKLASNSVSLDKLAPRTVGTTVPVGGLAISSSIGSFSTGADNVDVPGVAVTIVTSGRPVILFLIPGDPASGSSYVRASRNANSGTAAFGFARDSTLLSRHDVSVTAVGITNTGVSTTVPPGSVNFIDTTVPAGTHTYQLKVVAVSGTAAVNNIRLVAYEL